MRAFISRYRFPQLRAACRPSALNISPSSTGPEPEPSPKAQAHKPRLARPPTTNAEAQATGQATGRSWQCDEVDSQPCSGRSWATADPTEPDTGLGTERERNGNGAPDTGNGIERTPVTPMHTHRKLSEDRQYSA